MTMNKNITHDILSQNDRISIIITCFNQANYICDAIHSCLAQTLPPFEIIVVDDMSTDGTADLASTFGDRIIYYRQTENKGVVLSRNIGAEKSSGNFILFLDADDTLIPDALERMIAPFNSRSNVSFAYGDAQLFGDLKGQLHSLPLTELTISFLYLRNFIANSILIRRETFFNLSGYDQAFNRIGLEDWDFILRLVEQNNIGVYVGKTTLCYRIGKHTRNAIKSNLALAQCLIRTRHSVRARYGMIALLRASILLRIRQLLLIRVYGPYISLSLHSCIKVMRRHLSTWPFASQND